MRLLDTLRSLFSKREPAFERLPEPEPRAVGVPHSAPPPAASPPAASPPAVPLPQVPAHAPPVAPLPSPPPAPAAPFVKLPVTVTHTDSGSDIEVSDAEIAGRLQQYAYVMTSQTRDRDFHPWFDSQEHQPAWEQRRSEAYRWLELFIPAEAIKSEVIHRAAQRGPGYPDQLLVAVRTLLREKRRNKEPHDDLLRALYETALLVNFLKSVRFEYESANVLCDYIDIEDLRAAQKSYLEVGHEQVPELNKTDVKWLTTAFGTPRTHRSATELWQPVLHNAISRYCSTKMLSERRQQVPGELLTDEMRRWLGERLRLSIRIDKENQARAAARLKVREERDAKLAEIAYVWEGMQSDFVVADLETTGLEPASADVLEMAALVVTPAGEVVREFAGLVNVGTVPAEITELTGITTEMSLREGRPLAEVFAGFVETIGDRPVYFHNAPFDVGFVNKVIRQTGIRPTNTVFDTLEISRAAWPGMRSHRLSTLVKIIDDAPPPDHRALGDARATLAVLLAARQVAGKG